MIISVLSTPLHCVCMYAVYAMQNTSGGSNQACVGNNTGLDEWKCIFAPVKFRRQFECGYASFL